MARRKIREYEGKKIFSQHFLTESSGTQLAPFQSFLITPETNISTLALLEKQKYVVKPDMLFGKRKQYGLVLLNASPAEILQWLQNYRDKPFALEKNVDVLTHFLIEPQIFHEKEYYLSITSEREGDLLQFSSCGGAGIEERWNTVNSVLVPTTEDVGEEYLRKLTAEETLYLFLKEVFTAFRQFHFCTLEINPFTVTPEGKFCLLDLVAEVDDCATHLHLWNVDFPSHFGRKISAEEEHIRALDQESGASLKLTLLNPEGRVWNLLSGGGASIISLDSLSHIGLGREIANYGEYSGNPTQEESYQYAKTVLQLMTKEKRISNSNSKLPNNKNKVLLIAGAIANFTDVEKTFSGIIRALEEYQDQLKESKTKIIVRRGGPNYEKGLQSIKQAGERLGLSMDVYGPEMPLAEVARRVEEVVSDKW